MMTNSTDDEYLRFNEPPVNPDDEDEEEQLDRCLVCGGAIVWKGERFWCGKCKVFI